MKKEKLLDLFPLKGKVTKKIINNSDKYDVNNCIGVQTLKNAMGNKLKLTGGKEAMWGCDSGGFFKKGDDTILESYYVTGGLVNMMKIKKPTHIIFKIKT